MTLNITAADIGKKVHNDVGGIDIITGFIEKEGSMGIVICDNSFFNTSGQSIGAAKRNLISRVQDEPVMGDVGCTKQKAFYVVWSPEKGKPIKKHETLESAQTECVRLAKENVCDFYILKAISVTSRNEPKTEELV
jgi:hypothetical protein